MLAQNSKGISIFLSGKQLRTKNTFFAHGICAVQREFQAVDKLLKYQNMVKCTVSLILITYDNLWKIYHTL